MPAQPVLLAEGRGLRRAEQAAAKEKGCEMISIHAFQNFFHWRICLNRI